MTRVLRVLAALVVLSLLGSGCTKKKDDTDKLEAVIDATTPNSFRFVYTVTEDGSTLKVQGLIQDDLRYKLQLTVDDRPALEQVVVDDAVAVRFYAPGLVDRFLDKEIIPSLEPDDRETSIPGTDVLEALQAQRWVIDRSGAPSLLGVDQTAVAAEESEDKTGVKESEGATNDPLFDARTTLSYVRRVAQQQPVIRYDPDSLDVVYKKGQDPFPLPDPGSGVDRYDASIAELPDAEEASRGGRDAALPGLVQFRKLSTYTKAGRVLAVREFTGLSDQQEKDLFKFLDQLLEGAADPKIAQGFRDSYNGAAVDQRKQVLVNALNVFRENAGRGEIRFRTMTFEIQDVGDPTIQIALPTEEVIEANLSILLNMGRKPIKAAEDSTGATTTTAAADGSAATTPTTVTP